MTPVIISTGHTFHSALSKMATESPAKPLQQLIYLQVGHQGIHNLNPGITDLTAGKNPGHVDKEMSYVTILQKKQPGFRTTEKRAHKDLTHKEQNR